MAGDLLPGENQIIKVHQHWIFILKSLLIPIAVLILVALAEFTLMRDTESGVRWIVALGVAALALVWLIVVWIRWQSISYTLTDQRIKIESGVFGRQSKMIPIDRVQDCSTRQSLFGRMLGYGRVEVDAAGAQGAEVLDHLPQPGSFRDQVFVQSERRRGAPSSPASPSGV